MRPPCTIDGCADPQVGRGWCRKHYLRWHKTGDPMRVRKPVRTGVRLFDPGMYNATPLETPCREWLGRRDPKGYGLIGRAGKHWRLHRYVWTVVHGPIPEGALIMHRCDNPPCYRLDHLMLGTAKANTHDMLTKDRQSNGSNRTNPAVVMAMRVDASTGMTVRMVAGKYGLSVAATHSILTGRRWKHVGGPLFIPNHKHRRKAA